MADDESKKRARGADDSSGLKAKAAKWVEEFDALDDDDQYTYLEEMAPKMFPMHVQFLQGLIGMGDDDEEEEDCSESGSDEEDGEDGEGSGGDDED